MRLRWTAWICAWMPLTACGARSELQEAEVQASGPREPERDGGRPDEGAGGEDAGPGETRFELSVSGQANLYKDSGPYDGGISPALSSAAGFCAGAEIAITADGCVVDDGPRCTGPDGDGSSIFHELPVYSLIGRWGTSAAGLTASTAEGPPFFVGSSSVVVAPSTPGDHYLYLGENDGVFEDNTGDYQVVLLQTGAGDCS